LLPVLVVVVMVAADSLLCMLIVPALQLVRRYEGWGKDEGAVLLQSKEAIAGEVGDRQQQTERQQS
jgi:hypothetical protein